MKVLSTVGLTKLIEIIKDSFIAKIDTVTTNTINLADVAVTGDYNDLINQPDLTAKQDTLVSGVNIKTINNESLLGSGNITVSGISQINGNPLIEATTVNGVVSLTPQTVVHEQSLASDTWEITHNLGKYPSVTLVDSAGTVFGGAITYDSLNKCTIRMNGASTGKAFLN